MTEFNLIDQPWIPVLAGDGTFREIGIREALLHAAEFTRLAAELPTISTAIQRLLQAVLLRAAGPLPRTPEAKARLWGEWWEKGGLPRQNVDAYLDQWHDRFNLFDTRYPFFQVPNLTLCKEPGPGLTKLIADVPANNKLFVTRAGSGMSSLTFTEAAQWLVHAQAFDCAGNKSGVVGDARVYMNKSMNLGPTAWTGNLGVISLEGATLAETMLLNLCLPATSTEDRPIWETAPQRIASDAIYPIPRGAAQAWTWPSRMIRLIPSGESVVNVVLSNGEKLSAENRFAEEPMTAWRPTSTKANVFKPFRLGPGYAAWQGLSSLLAESTGAADMKARPAGVLEWLGLLRNLGELPERHAVAMHYTAMTYGKNSSTFEQVFDDTVPASVAILGSARLRRIAVLAPGDARKGVMALRDFAKHVALATGDSGDDVATKLADLEAGAYDTLRPLFEEWLQGLTPESSQEAALTRWQVPLTTALKQIATEHARLAPTSAAVGRLIRLTNGEVHMDVGLAMRWFNGALRRNFPLAHPALNKEDKADATVNE